MKISIRPAELTEIETLQRLICRSARGLASDDYTSEQIEAALGSAWGVDSQLIRDRTYFAVEIEAKLVACGGWSKRQALFGADALSGTEPALLDPGKDAARIRAFFVHPDWVRRGIGKALLAKCEAEAYRNGFRAAELVATLPGQRLYTACGYQALGAIEFPLRNGLSITFVPMRKVLLSNIPNGLSA